VKLFAWQPARARRGLGCGVEAEQLALLASYFFKQAGAKRQVRASAGLAAVGFFELLNPSFKLAHGV